MNKGVKLICAGIATTVVGYFWMISLGLGGIIVAPIPYVVGPTLFVWGAIWSLGNRREVGVNRNLIFLVIFTSVLAVAFAIGQSVTTRDENRNKYCEAKYPYTYSGDYETNDNTRCIRHQID